MSGTTEGPQPPADGGPYRARVPGRLDRQPGRRHSDDVLEHRHRRSRHHLSFGERRHRLRSDRTPGRGGPQPRQRWRPERHAEGRRRGGAPRRSFAIIRGGRIDVTVMGAYEVACNGDFANWKITGQKGGGIGARWISRRVRSVCSSSWSRHAQRCTALGGAMRAAGDGARRGEAGGDELRPVRAHRRRVPHSRDPPASRWTKCTRLSAAS